MTTTTACFGSKITSRSEIIAAVIKAHNDSLAVIIHFKQTSTRPRPPLWTEIQHCTPVGEQANFSVGYFWITRIRFDDVETIEIGHPIGSDSTRSMTPLVSADRQPFHNGFCWQHSGEPVQHVGYCTNILCVDPHADLKKRAMHGLPTGKYWGASITGINCDCGEAINLT